MALRDTDLFIVQRDTQSYKMPATELASAVSLTLQEVTDNGNTTDNSITVGDLIADGPGVNLYPIGVMQLRADVAEYSPLVIFKDGNTTTDAKLAIRATGQVLIGGDPIGTGNAAIALNPDGTQLYNGIGTWWNADTANAAAAGVEINRGLLTVKRSNDSSDTAIQVVSGTSTNFDVLGDGDIWTAGSVAVSGTKGGPYNAFINANGTIVSGSAYNVGDGTALYSTGLVGIRKDGAKAGVFQVLKDGFNTDTNETISFDNEGFAKFAGNITLNGANTNNTVRFENTTNFNAGITWNSANNTGFTFNDSNDSGNAKLRIQNDGVRIGTNASNTATTNITLNADGEASFAGHIHSTNWPTGTDWFFLGSGGTIGLRNDNTSTNNTVINSYQGGTDLVNSLFTVYADGKTSIGPASDPTISLAADGNGHFGGPLATEKTVEINGSLGNIQIRTDNPSYNSLVLYNNGNTAADATFTVKPDGTLRIGGNLIGDPVTPNVTLHSGGTVSSRENDIILSTAPDFTEGNFWHCVGGFTILNPTNAVAGTSGLIRLTGAPTGWGVNYKFPGGSPPEISVFPAVIPYYVQDETTILMGNKVEGMA